MSWAPVCRAVENMRLEREVQQLHQDLDTQELQRLGEDVGALRDQLLAQGDQVKRLQSTPTVRRPLVAHFSAAHQPPHAACCFRVLRSA